MYQEVTVECPSPPPLLSLFLSNAITLEKKTNSKVTVTIAFNFVFSWSLFHLPAIVIAV